MLVACASKDIISYLYGKELKLLSKESFTSVYGLEPKIKNGYTRSQGSSKYDFIVSISETIIF